MRNNKKGFTLIELLAVIVILAILVMLAIPAVTRYLNEARTNTFADNALRAVEAVRNDVVTAGFSTNNPMSGTTNRTCTTESCTYGVEAINDLLENKLTTSSFGAAYDCVSIVVSRTNNTYTMTMVDKGGNGFTNMPIDKISKEKVSNKGDQVCTSTTQTPAD